MVDLVPEAPINYSQMRSDVKRFQPMGREAGMLDVVYDIDSAHKQSLSTVRTLTARAFRCLLAHDRVLKSRLFQYITISTYGRLRRKHCD